VRIIYVAGPYRSDTQWGVYQNIREAEKVAIKLWRENWVVFCPHLNTQLFNEVCRDIPTEVWLRGGLEILKRCDAIWMMGNWRQSKGARAELKLAKMLGLEIHYG